MKNILYIIGAILLFTISCTKFDKEDPIPFVSGPNVVISVDDLALGDSTFTFTLTPGSGVGYYSYLVVKENNARTLDATNVLRTSLTGLSKLTINSDTAATYQVKLKGLDPFTTYQIYAVAANKNGMVGSVANTGITTTDGVAPRPSSFKYTGAVVEVTFSEVIERGTGKISGTYYSSHPAIAEEGIVEIIEDSISVSGKVLTVKLPEEFVAGAYVCLTWEAGAVQDVIGNDCNAYSTKGYDTANNRWTGINGRIPVVAWEIEGPEDLESFSDWAAFVITLTPEVTISGKLATADVKLTYVSEGKETTFTLPSNLYGVAAGNIAILLPEEPIGGAFINVNIAEKTFADKYGNPNKAFELKKMYLFSFGYTMADILGTYSISGISALTSTLGQIQTESNVTIEEDTEVDNGVIIKNLLSNLVSGAPVSEIYGVFDPHKGTISIEDWQSYGFTLDFGASGTGDMIFANGINEDPVIFNVPEPGKITSSTVWGHYADPLGWYRAFSSTEWTRGAPSPAPSPLKSSASKEIHQDFLKKR